jgi:2,4-dienoyl-CoA reductase-like NADH-dependent reductase (Old Yellow Enzyme family)
MALETYDIIRQYVGSDFPILIKANVTDGFDGGVLFEDVLYLCQTLAQKGIDAIEITGAWNNIPKEATSYFRKEAEIIAAECKTNVIMTGGNQHFEEMTEILNTTKIGYFGMARALMKDADLINKFEKQYKQNGTDFA